MRRWFWLVLWLSGILFPLAWIKRFSPVYEQVFDALFSPEWVHWVMHASMYAGLIILVHISFNLRPSWQTLGLLFLLTLWVSILQESLQLASGVQVFGWNICLDLVIDMLGAAIGFIISTVYSQIRQDHSPMTKSRA